MSGTFLVSYDVMAQAAEDQEEAASYTLKIEQVRQGAVLDRGALGKILPSEEIVTGFQEATDETRASLEALVETCEALAETVTLVSEHFRQVDQAIADQFNQMLGA